MNYWDEALNFDGVKLAEIMDRALKTQWDARAIKITAERYKKNNIMPRYYDLVSKYM